VVLGDGSGKDADDQAGQTSPFSLSAVTPSVPADGRITCWRCWCSHRRIRMRRMTRLIWERSICSMRGPDLAGVVVGVPKKITPGKAHRRERETDERGECAYYAGEHDSVSRRPPECAADDRDGRNCSKIAKGKFITVKASVLISPGDTLLATLDTADSNSSDDTATVVIPCNRAVLKTNRRRFLLDKIFTSLRVADYTIAPKILGRKIA